MFRLTAFPASDGDCLLLSWGEAAPFRHILVDGGRQRAYRTLKPALERIAAAGEAIDLLILSHIDADHIEGLLKLIKEPQPPVEVREVWYNGFDQMKEIEVLGFRQGDQFSKALAASGLSWNRHFDGKAVAIQTGGTHRIPIEGLTLTLVSPDVAKLRALRSDWLKWRTKEAAERSEEERRPPLLPGVEAFGPRPMPAVLDVDALAAAPSQPDDEPPNGSSIAVIADWGGKRVLLAGDAHPDLLERSLTPLAAQEGGRYRIDLYKVSHHGSRGNTTPRLLELLDCRRFLISTNGSHHGHPDPEAIAQLIKHAPTGEKIIYFNYRNGRTDPWSDPALCRTHSYRTVFPTDTAGILPIEI